GAEPVDPPRVAAVLQLVPAVNRIAPQLAGRAEVIGRYARHDVGSKQLGMTHHIGTVARHVDGQIAHDANPTLPAVLVQRGPLPVEFELPKTLDVGAELGLLSGHEASKIVQPVGVAIAVAVESLTLARAAEEPLRGLGQNRQFPLNHATVVDACLRELRLAADFLPAEVTPLNQAIQAEKERIPGEGREALVR